MNANQCRKLIADAMRDNSYSDRDIHMFLAGATLLGYLHDERASWARDHLTRDLCNDMTPFDSRINAAGVTYIIHRKDHWNQPNKIASGNAAPASTPPAQDNHPAP